MRKVTLPRLPSSAIRYQHVDILSRIDQLRSLTHAGVEVNAAAIAQGIISFSSLIKLHLAVEDKALYPALQRSGDATLARLGQQFQDDMGPIAQAFDGFARRWNTAERLRSDPQGFRNDANTVLKRVYERMQRENREFYPRIEEAQTNAVARGANQRRGVRCANAGSLCKARSLQRNLAITNVIINHRQRRCRTMKKMR